MDRRLLWFLALIGIFIAGNALADTNLAQPDTSVDGLLDLILNQSGQWSQRLYGYAINLFWLLATIQLVWTFMPLVLKQADIGEIAGELVRFILVTGFFLAMMKYAVEWATAIVDSFVTRELPRAALNGHCSPETCSQWQWNFHAQSWQAFRFFLQGKRSPSASRHF
jgi:P-type conjugative transfer protein TrbL